MILWNFSIWKEEVITQLINVCWKLKLPVKCYVVRTLNITMWEMGPHKRPSKEYHAVTEKACNLFLHGFEECNLQKPKKSDKFLVVKPISSTRFLSRCQLDLIGFRDMSEEHNRLECDIPSKWLLVYQDHLTKNVVLRTLKHKSADE